MTRPHPVPSPRLSLLRRLVRIMRLVALVAIAIAALAVAVVARGASGAHGQMLIVAALGVGLTVLLATGLMTLTYLNSSSGHGERVANPQKEEQ